MASASTSFNYAYVLSQSFFTFQFSRSFTVVDSTTFTVSDSVDANSNFDLGETITSSNPLLNGAIYFGVVSAGTTPGITVVKDGSLLFLAKTSIPPNTVLGFPVFTSSPVCLVAGTLIATPDGDRAIESLEIGDLVLTPSGAQKVKFVAQSSHHFKELLGYGKTPVHIAAGALGEELPAQDLCLSPSHAVLLEGLLVEAGALINGTTIVQITSSEEIFHTFYNIELENHDLIWANGLQAETYYANWRGDVSSRKSWNNYAEYVSLYGESSPMNELDKPRVAFARQLPASVRKLIDANALLPV